MDDKKIGTSRLNIDTDNKSGYNFSNIKILEDWLNIETLSYDEQFDGDFYNVSNKDILLDLFLMKHPETQKNGIFITSSSLQDTINANKQREKDIVAENYKLKKLLKAENYKLKRLLKELNKQED